MEFYRQHIPRIMPSDYVEIIFDSFPPVIGKAVGITTLKSNGLPVLVVKSLKPESLGGRAPDNHEWFFAIGSHTHKKLPGFGGGTRAGFLIGSWHGGELRGDTDIQRSDRGVVFKLKPVMKTRNLISQISPSNSIRRKLRESTCAKR